MKYELKSFLVGSLIFILLDTAFLLFHKKLFERTVITIQKTSMQLRMESLFVCYVLLTVGLWYFIVRKHRSPLEAFALGILVYGVYETTTYAAFKHWPVSIVVMDTLWGGLLFGTTTAATYQVMKIL